MLEYVHGHIELPLIVVVTDALVFHRAFSAAEGMGGVDNND
jgi:hypothetical protein